jgi:GNAT superfamily N-acetyltransferase
MTSMTAVSITREGPEAIRTELTELVELHQAAFPEVEGIGNLADLEGEPLVLVAWDPEHRPIGYIVASIPAVGEVELWEHLVHPDHRHQGLGRRLLHELARTCDPGTGVLLDPTGQLDPEREADYYRKCGFERRDATGHLWATAAAVRTATAADPQSAPAPSS